MIVSSSRMSVERIRDSESGSPESMKFCCMVFVVL